MKTDSRGGLDILPLIAASMVVLIHVFAGVIDVGRPVFRPVGHLTLLLVFWWPIALLAAAVALLARRGRSWRAGVAVGVVFVSYLLLSGTWQP
jgi:hypothetical protein